MLSIKQLGSVVRILAFVLSLALGANPSAARDTSRDMPTTEAGFFQAGETFARCSAHVALAAEMARGQGMPDTAISFENNKRAWQLAGMMLLAAGLTPSRQPSVEQVFIDMEAGNVERLRAWREADPDGYGERLTEQYQVECLPWVDVQKSIIAVLRGAEAPR